MIPLNKLIGSENLPREEYDYFDEGYHAALKQINQCTVGLDEEAIKDIISEFGLDGDIHDGISLDIAKAIASKPDLVIKIGRNK